VTGYRLKSAGIKFWWGQNFLHTFRPALGHIQPPVRWLLSLLPGRTVVGVWQWPPTLPSAKVKERVQLCLYSPPGPSWPMLGWTLPSSFYITLPMNTITNFFWCSMIINLYMMFHVSLVSLIQFFPYKALPLPIVILQFEAGFQECNLCK